MAKLLLVVLFLLVASPVLAAEVLTDSGLKIQIPDSEIAFYQDNGLVARFPSGLFWWIQTIVHVPVAQGAELTLEQQIKLYIYIMADEYDVNGDELIKLARCESNFQIDAHNPKDPQGGAWGLFQYLKPTFLKWQKESGIKGGFLNWQTQTELTAWAWGKGRQNAWLNCWNYQKYGT